ncbi:hypothetical protein E5288_WYG007168 [Bos mutus]|uniref:RRM domain-containing protein n=1 Tax=Bos mutus TaxID=72004 RepID=A0A6B0QPH6_9CETA|nr:hypothetical protein [Bos mutus]
MNTVPPPPIPPIPAMPSLPPIPSIPPIPVPPLVPTMPPVPSIPPVPSGSPMTPLPPMSGILPLNPPPVAPLPPGMNGSGAPVNLNNNLNPVFLGPLNPINPVQMNSQSNVEPLPINPDDLSHYQMDVLQFLEGIPVDENAVHVLVDNNGQGLGQALVQFKNEDDAWLGRAFGDARPGMPSVGNSGLPGLGLDVPGFGSGPNNLSGPGFGGGP